MGVTLLLHMAGRSMPGKVVIDVGPWKPRPRTRHQAKGLMLTFPPLRIFSDTSEKLSWGEILVGGYEVRSYVVRAV